MTQRQGSWRKRRGLQQALGPRLAEVEGGLARGFLQGGLGLVIVGHFKA
jgi:hypothetical protein